jgi:hypothetical protein
MTILGGMAKKLMRPRGGRELGTTLYKEIERGLDIQFGLLKPYVDRDDLRIASPSHLLDAVLAYVLTRGAEEQRAILTEGRRIVGTLAALKGPGEPVMPGSYGTAPSAVGSGGSDNHGRDTVGRATTVPDIIRRNTGRAARGPGRKKKGPKAKGSPAFGVGQ